MKVSEVPSIGDVALDAGPGGAKEASDHVFRCSDGMYMT